MPNLRLRHYPSLLAVESDLCSWPGTRSSALHVLYIYVCVRTWNRYRALSSLIEQQGMDWSTANKYPNWQRRAAKLMASAVDK